MADIQSNFDFISSYCESSVNVGKYQSKRTGMKLYHINLPLPVIKLEICVQTKPYDDTGCAHTLEHLIFLGSRKYPQQGYLDYISAQLYSLGTNATTYRDMTTYELTTVNYQSLSTLLPIYLDHIFNPLLTNDCYLTEIHHISGETGNDAGVVYSEIQSSENQPDEILLFSILRDLWSDKSPYYYEAGGRLESIRNELTLDKIKLFHQKFYKPNNIAIILCGGGINLNEIIEILNKFEEENFFQYENCQTISIDYSFDENQRKKTKLTNDKLPLIEIKSITNFDENIISSKTPQISIDTRKLSVQLPTNDGNESSFCDSELMVSNEDLSLPSPLSSSLLPTIEIDNSNFNRSMNEYKEICYPVEDNEENLGQVAFGYRLESIYEMEIYTAIDILLTTLFDEDISIFYKEFIEIPNILCSSIDHDWFNYPERILTITFEGVEIDNLTIVADKYSSVLYSIINSQMDNEQFYIQLQRNIKKKIELHLNEIESDPYTYLTDLCCLDHISELSINNIKLENNHQQNLNKFLQNKTYLENLYNRSINYWHELIKKYLLEWDSTKRTIILLKPSYELLNEQQEQEEQRIAQRLETFSSNDLEKLKTELNQARFNNKQSSSECSNIPNLSIKYHNELYLPPIEYYSNNKQIDLFNIPTSHFNKYTLHIPIENLPYDLQIYLPLFSNLLFHTSIQYENISLTKYNFCELITRDILSYSVSNGQTSSSPIQSSYVHTHYIDKFIISLQSINNNIEIYKTTINYFRYVLFGTIFTDYKIIQEECEKQLKNLIESLQNGETIHQAYFNSLLHINDKKNYYHQMNIFIQKKFFEKICKHFQKYQNEIISKLELIKLFILKNLSQLHLTICGNIKLIKEDWQFIEQFINECQIKSQIEFSNNQINDNKDKSIAIYSPATIIGSQHEESGDRTAINYGENILSFRAIFNDVRNSVERVHMKGKLKEMVCKDIEKYIHKDDQLSVLLDRIRSHNAKTFLLTNSEYWYTDKLMTYLLTNNNQNSGRDWKSYFNFIVVDAQKPLFFAEGTTLRIIDPNTGSMKLGSYAGELQQNEVYSGGSCEVFSKLIGSMGKDVLYVGDHIFGDIIKSKKQKAWRTMLVVPELNHELRVFHDKRDLFNTLEVLDTSISELLRSFDMTSNQGPEAVSKIKQKIQQCTHELDMNFGLLGSLFRTGSRQTHFASQVSRFADIYASTVVNLVYYPFFYFFRAVPQLMPHESTVDPEEPMHFKSWGDEESQPDTFDHRRRTPTDQMTTSTNSFNHQTSIQTHPDLPRHVTHDHDDDGDPDDEQVLDIGFDLQSQVTYTPPHK